MKEVFYLSAVVASISFTMTETKLFGPVREWLKKKSSFIGEVFSCGYCFGFWVALGLVIIYRPQLFKYVWLLDYVFTALVIAWLAAFQWGVMCWLMERAGK